MQTFPQEEINFTLQGPAGVIEVLTTAPKNGVIKGTAIICHPHPLFSGTMHNKVVTTLAKVFDELNLRTLRFNFRGVGKSEGIHDEGRGETEDVCHLIRWVDSVFPGEPIWLAGFSFGAFVAAKAATKIPVARLVCIAPQVSRFGDTDLSLIHCPWILVQGEQDEVIPPQTVYDWIDQLAVKPKLIRLEAGHFFHGKLLELRHCLLTELSTV